MLTPEQIASLQLMRLQQREVVAFQMTNIIAMCPELGDMGKNTIGNFLAYITPHIPNIQSSGFQPVSGTALPATQNKYTIVPANTYTQPGGPDVVAPLLLNLLSIGTGKWEFVTGVTTDALVTKDFSDFGGYFTSVSLAIAGVPNTTAGGKKFRSGKYVLIGQPEAYIRYEWIGGTADVNLVKAPIQLKTLSRNMFPSTNLSPGEYIDFATGSRVPIVGYSSTKDGQPIKCDPSTVYTTNYMNYAYAFLNKNMQYISGIAAPAVGGIVTTPALCEYFSTYVQDSEKDFLMIVKGSDVFAKDQYVKGDDLLGIKAENVTGIDLKTLDKKIDGVNLFDSDKIRTNSYADRFTGSIVHLEDEFYYYTSEPISVKSCATYEFGDTVKQQYVVYDKDGKFLLDGSYASVESGESKLVTMPVKAKKIVFTGVGANLPKQYFVEKMNVSLHNPANKINGKYVAFADGSIINNPTTSVTTLPVKPNVTYEFGSLVQQQFGWFRKDGSFISGYSGSVQGYEKQVTSPNEAFLIKYTTNIADDVAQTFRKVDEVNVIRTIKITVAKNANNWLSIRTVAQGIKDASYNKRYEIGVPIGVWNEIDFNGWGEFVKIKGQDRYRTIIVTDGSDTNATHIIPSDYMGTGEYSGQQVATVPLIWKHSMFAIKDLNVENCTFKAINCKYVVHADDKRWTNILLSNCSFEETGCNFVFGVGIWAGQTALIENFTCKRNTINSAGFVFHNTNNQMKGSKFVFKNGKFDNCYFGDVYENGSDQEDALLLENCYSNLDPKVKFFVSMDGSKTFYIKPSTGLAETDPLLVPYCIHLVIASTNVATYDISSNQRPNAIQYIQTGQSLSDFVTIYSDKMLPDGYNFIKIDRPDLPDNAVFVDANLNIIQSPLRTGAIDRPDLETVFIDTDNNIISVILASTGEVIIFPLPLLFNPKEQLEINQAATNLVDYTALLARWNSFFTDFPANPDIPVYLTKTNLGKSSTGNFDLWRYDLKPTKPKFKVILVTGTHASEKIYIDHMYNFCKLFIDATVWSGQDTLTWIRNNIHFVVIPCLAPSALTGFVAGSVGGRRVWECDDFPVSWTKSGSDVTVTYNTSDFPNTGGRLDAATYFSGAGLVGKLQVSLFGSSNQLGLPDDGYVIKSVTNGTTIVVTTPSASGATSGTARMYVSVDPNRNMDTPDGATWIAFTPSTAKVKYSNDQVGVGNDNKGTKPFSLAETIIMKNLYNAESNFDFVLDCHSGSGDNYLGSSAVFTPAGLNDQLTKLKYFIGQFDNTDFSRIRQDVATSPFYSAYVAKTFGKQGYTIEWSQPAILNPKGSTNAFRWMINVITQMLQVKN